MSRLRELKLPVHQAGLPCGRPGRGEEIEGAMQQAAQPGRQSMPRIVARIVVRHAAVTAALAAGEGP